MITEKLSRNISRTYWVLGLIFFSSLMSQSRHLAANENSKPPNVLVILSDDSGYSDLGCYGGEIETPQLDKLAANGLQFTNFYNTGRCWPTRAALLSGYYPHQIHRDKLPAVRGGIIGRRQKWARLLPDLLKSAGYRSYHSGKWHIDGPCLAAGFDRSLDMRNQGNFFKSNRNRIDDKPIQSTEVNEDYYATTATADHAIECLRDHARDHADQPFFQYVAFIAPHFPLHAKPEDIAKYADRYQAGWDAMRTERFEKQKQLKLFEREQAGEKVVTARLSNLEPDVGPPYDFPDAIEKLGAGEINRPLPWDELTEEQQKFQATKMAIHAAMVDRMDQEIGRLIEQLKAMGQFENTLIFYCSDNGASAEIMVRNGGHDPTATPGSEKTFMCLGPGFSSACNTPFRRHKTWVHEGGIATPLIVHWPAGIAAKGELRHQPTHVIDIVPTILETIDLEKPADWDGEPIPPAPGQSIVSTFADQNSNPQPTMDREPIFWLHDGHRALRDGSLKLVAAKDETWQLYDLAKDRSETNDLAAEQPGKVEELEAIWNRKVAEFSALVAKTADKNLPKNKNKKKTKTKSN